MTIYVDGTRDVTAYAMFRLRHGVKTHGERHGGAGAAGYIEREVWRRNLRRDLPEGDARTQFQSVTVSQSPYMLETDGDTAVFQFSLEINYVQAV